MRAILAHIVYIQNSKSHSTMYDAASTKQLQEWSQFEDSRYGEIEQGGEILKGKQMGLVWENFGEG